MEVADMPQTNETWDKLFDDLPIDTTPTADHQAELRALSLAQYDNQSNAQLFPTRLKRAQRIVMKYKIQYLTAAALVVSVCISMLSSSAPAMANVVKHIIEARTASWDTIVRSEGSPDQRIGFNFAPGHSRQEFEGTGMVMIIDWNKAEAIGIFPSEKRAMLMNASGFDRDTGRHNHFEKIQDELRDVMRNPNRNVEELGERQIDGDTLVGFRFRREFLVITIWADPDSGFPIRIESDVSETTRVIMTNYQSNFEADPSLFSLDVPDGYRLVDTRNGNSPLSLGDENDLVVSLRLWAEGANGVFPARLDSNAGAEASARYLALVNDRAIAAGIHPSPEENLEILKRASTGLTFALELSKDQKWDAHYAGASVKLGTPKRPIFWYKPSNSNMYRVIYADLSTRDEPEAPDGNSFAPPPMKLSEPSMAQ